MDAKYRGVALALVLMVSLGAYGQTWQQLAHVGRMDSLRASDIEALLVPAPGIYLAATDKGIYQSSDAGSHWSAPWGASAWALFSHPDGRIFAGIHSGLAVSTNLGVTWSLVPGHPSTLDVNRIARDSQGRLFTGQWSFASSTGGGVQRSTDNGVTWLKVLDSVEVETLAWGPGDVLYAGGYNTLRRSTNAGQTWQRLFDSAGVRSLVVTQNGSILFGWYLVNPSLKMATYRSTDNGGTWGRVAGFFSEYFATDTNNFVYAACDSGLRKTTDNGTSWQVLNTGLRNLNGVIPWLRTLSRTGGAELIAGEYSTGEIFRSSDLGAHWSTVSVVETLRATTAKLSAFAFKAPDKLFVASSLYGMERSTGGGGLMYVNNGLVNQNVQAVYVSRTGSVFAGTVGGVYRSTDDGASWAKFGAPTTSIRALSDLPNGAVLAGVVQGVVRYADDGSSFSLMNAGLVNKNVNTFCTVADGRSFVGTDDGLYRLDSVTWVPVGVSSGALKVIDIKVDGQTLAIAARDSGIYVSTNNGQLWQQKRAGIEGVTVRALAVVAPDRLYAATEQNGVYAATIGGAAWTPFAQGLNDLNMRGLALGTDGYLYAITDSGAVNKTSARVTGVPEATSLAPTAFALEQNYPNPFNPGTTIGFRVSGPGSSWVKLAVYDLLGREVAVLVNERKEPGNYETTLDGAGLSSGVYFYQLKAGDFVASRRLILLK